MFSHHIIFTVNQKILNLLVKFSDREFYERQIARKLSIGYGSANSGLNELYSSGAVKRRQEGKMYFYSIDSLAPIVSTFKKLINILLAEPLAEELKNVSNRVILYGSCAQGTDTSQSDMDIFVVSNYKDEVIKVIDSFTFPPGFEEIHIQMVVKTPVELMGISKPEQTFIEQVEQGIILWEKVTGESRV